jgi:prepilin-type N-terminal cleavage/methylation domain-containing protein
MSHRSAFTLIELLVVIAIIAILSIVVILTLNPAQLLLQAHDANRLSDLSTLNTALGVYAAEGGSSLGSSNVVYVSIPDPSATSSLGDQCQGLGLPTAPSGTTYFCASSSTYRSTNGLGWIPLNFSSLSGGSPLGQLPIDIVNTTSTGHYYTYATNGTQYVVTSLPESQKYLTQYELTPSIPLYPGVMANGSNLTIDPLWNSSGLVGWWPLTEGSGSTTIDASGNGNGGTWSGTPVGNNSTYYTSSKVGAYAGNFDGGTDYVGTGTGINLYNSGWTVAFWANKNSNSGTGEVVGTASNANFSWPLSSVLSSGVFKIARANNSSYLNVSAPAALSVSIWHYYAGTFNVATGIATLYEDGAQIATGSLALTISNQTYYGALGALQNGNQGIGYYFNGSIDDARIYNRALSAAEVQAIYNAEN